MRISLLRHGIAMDREDPRCPVDPKRTLTDRGVRRTRAAMHGLAALGIRPKVLLCSPYLRAVQTAELAQEVLSPRVPITVVPTLVPAGQPAAMVDAISAVLDGLLPDRGSADVLCVGHAPSLDELLGYLLGADREFVRLKKSGVATLEVSTLRRGGATLQALVPPRALRGLSGQR